MRDGRRTIGLPGSRRAPAVMGKLGVIPPLPSPAENCAIQMHTHTSSHKCTHSRGTQTPSGSPTQPRAQIHTQKQTQEEQQPNSFKLKQMHTYHPHSSKPRPAHTHFYSPSRFPIHIHPPISSGTHTVLHIKSQIMHGSTGQPSQTHNHSHCITDKLTHTHHQRQACLHSSTKSHTFMSFQSRAHV